MKLLYVGRLDREKWIETLIQCIELFIVPHQKEINISIDFFGKGEFSDHIDKLAQTYPHIVRYHGWIHKQQLLQQRSGYDFFVMPSNFLETFWLTACESWVMGVPVIGNKKWWLEMMIPDDLNIQQYGGNNDAERLANCLRSQKNKKKSDYNNWRDNIKTTYTTQHRINAIQWLSDKSYTKILMVSDFINYDAGWVETHINDACKLLQKNGSLCTIFGHTTPKGERSIMIKTLLTCASCCNMRDSRILLSKIQKESIWLIRRHGVSRVIGRLPLYAIRIRSRIAKKDLHQYITHHELGLFHPFPSKVQAIDDLPQAWDIRSFLQASETNNILIQGAVLIKYLLVRLIHKQLQYSNITHIVPSQRMVPLVQQWHPNAKVQTITHFVDMKN